MINLHERMLPTSAGDEPATSWSPVGRRIQLSHRGLYGLCTVSLGIFGRLCSVTMVLPGLLCYDLLLYWYITFCPLLRFCVRKTCWITVLVSFKHLGLLRSKQNWSWVKHTIFGLFIFIASLQLNTERKGYYVCIILHATFTICPIVLSCAYHENIHIFLTPLNPTFV